MSRIFQRILVPTDMSEFASLAIDHALWFQERLGSSLTLLYADDIRLPLDFMEYPLGYYLENAPASKAKIQQRLRDFAFEKAPESHIETIVVDDSPARAIVDVAKRMNADLIVMGTHGRSGLQRALLGSVTESVLRSAGGPVLTIAPALYNGHAIDIRRVLAAVPMMDPAQKIANALGAELMLLAITEDDPPDRLLALAERRDADLIIAGSMKQLLSRRASCAVLTLPPSWSSVTTGVVAHHGITHRHRSGFARGRVQ